MDTEFEQEFNYHNHTYRSGDSEYVSVEETLKTAKEIGIKILGFSEYAPNTNLEISDEDHHMMLSEVDGYISSINKMKMENPEMTILAGFEAEFDPMKEKFLGEMKEKVDYMILGQHSVKDGMKMVPQSENPNYPLEYAQMVCQGIESGLFDIVGHPDRFMSLRDTISDDDKAIYKENCIKASHMICQKAAEMGIPLEINLLPALNNQFLHDGNLAYPHPLFWTIARDYDVKVLKGINTNHLQNFQDLNEGQKRITNIEYLVSNKMIRVPYNPVFARQNNRKLQEAYTTHQKEALTYESQIINEITKNILESIGNKQDSESIDAIIVRNIDIMMQGYISRAKTKSASIMEEILKISNSQNLSVKGKSTILEEKEKALKEKETILAKQTQILEEVQNRINSIIKENPSYFQLSSEEPTKGSNSSGNTLTLTNNHIIGVAPVSSSENNGFVNTIMLTIMVTLAVGIIVGIIYMLYQFGIK